MTRFLIGAAAIALTAIPASAQLLGGGGGIGGGVGGGLGGIGGSATGTLSTMNRLPVDNVAAQARAQARQQARLEKRLARERRAGLAGNATTSLDGTAQVGQRSFAASAVTSGDTAAGTGASTLRARGAVAATQSGLRQTGTTASGVAVFAPPATASIAAPAVPTGVAVRSYPTYSRDYYYGYYGPDVVFVGPGQVDYYVDRQYDDLNRDLRGTGATVIRRGDDLVVQLPADVTFAFNKSDIRPQFYGALNSFARSLDEYPASDIEVIGHTDSVGSDSYNLALSDRRGRTVADFLVARRTDPRRLVVEAMGETQPLDTNATVQGRAANRRVEFIIHPRVS